LTRIQSKTIAIELALKVFDDVFSLRSFAPEVSGSFPETSGAFAFKNQSLDSASQKQVYRAVHFCPERDKIKIGNCFSRLILNTVFIGYGL
jgi:hypothetical protein